MGVITKKESKFNADFTDVTPLCKEYNIDYLCVENINDSKSIEFIHKCSPEIMYCFGWSQLIKDEVLKSIPYGGVGFHPAQLPNNRGRHPIIWALVLGLEKTASTFFMMDGTADTGDIVAQKMVDIAYEDDARTLYDKIMKTAEQQVVELWIQFENDTVVRIEQEKKGGNTWRKRGIKDGEIDWRMASRSIYNLVRGLTKPYVGAHFIFDNREIKVWKVQEIISDSFKNIEPGKVISKSKEGYIDVKAGENIIRILECEDIEIEVGEYL